jgi:hypothetical protein
MNDLTKATLMLLVETSPGETKEQMMTALRQSNDSPDRDEEFGTLYQMRP